MDPAPKSTDGRLDVLVLAPLPCTAAGKPAFQVGGSLHSLWLAEGLARLGHRVRVITTTPPRELDPEPVPAPSGVEIDWFAVDMADTIKVPSRESTALRRAQFEAALDRALAGGRPDVLVLGHEHLPWYAAQPGRERGLPMVLAAHGVPTAAIPDGILTPDELERLAAVLSQIELIVPVSDFLEDVLRDLGLTRLRTIITGTDLEAFAPRPKDPARLAAHDIGPDRFVVGSFAHFREEKRVLDVVASAEAVLREAPEAVYLLVGEGPQRAEVEAAIAARGLGESFRFAGEFTHPDVPAYMSLCDAIVVASDREGYSLVAREVQACGRPLIVSDIPAGRRAALDGQAAALFGVGDPDALAAVTLRLIRDPGERERLAGAGRAAVEAEGGGRWIAEWAEALAGVVSR